MHTIENLEKQGEIEISHFTTKIKEYIRQVKFFLKCQHEWKITPDCNAYHNRNYYCILCRCHLVLSEEPEKFSKEQINNIILGQALNHLPHGF